MGKVLALDVGEKRVGYAISDDSKKVAFPRATFFRRPESKLFFDLRKIIAEDKVEQILIGVPLDSDNEETEYSKKIKAFSLKLYKNLQVPIKFIDEFGTTNAATSKIPFRADRRQKGSRDPIAALIILQRFLDGEKAIDAEF